MADPWAQFADAPAADEWAGFADAPEQPKEGVGDYLKRELSPANFASAAVRPVVQAVTAIPGVFADAAMGAWNLATGQNNELPSQATGALLDRFTRKPEGIGKAAEVVSASVLGSKVPLPQIGKQAPAGFKPQRPEITQTQKSFENARKAGYVAPPATVKPSVGNVAAESLAGKAATQQLASRKNQQVTNDLVARGLGLAKGAQLTRQVLGDIRAKAGRVYAQVSGSGAIKPDKAFSDEVAALAKVSDEIAADFPDANIAAGKEIKQLVKSLNRPGFNAKSAMAYLRQLRKEGSANLTAARQAGGDPTKEALGRAQRDAAGALEDLVIRHLQAQGKGALAKQFDEARTMIAKTHSAESALNPATGNVRARDLATQLKRGKPLSGEFAAVAEFASAFPKAADEVLTSPGVSAIDAALTGGGALALGAGGGFAPAALLWPLGRAGARYSLLTPTAQNALIPQAKGFRQLPANYLSGGVAGANSLAGQ